MALQLLPGVAQLIVASAFFTQLLPGVEQLIVASAFPVQLQLLRDTTYGKECVLSPLATFTCAIRGCVVDESPDATSGSKICKSLARASGRAFVPIPQRSANGTFRFPIVPTTRQWQAYIQARSQR